MTGDRPPKARRHTNPERARATTNASVVNGQTAVTFNGLDIVDQEFDNRFDLEPPDQGVCAGNGLIIEHINLVLAVYTQSGSCVIGPAPSKFFFGVPRDFLSDPRCYFDPGTSRWFMTITDVASVDIIPGRGFLLVAVSFDARYSHWTLPTTVKTAPRPTRAAPFPRGGASAISRCWERMLTAST